ncbi:MAG: hypothetical protein WEB90_00830 [Gemmatimonadota bacterium]
MRLVAYAASLASVVALAGCSGDTEHTWAGPPDSGPDGVVAVDDFAEHQRSVEEPWEGSAAMAAAEFLRLDERTAVRTSIEGLASAEGTGPETVVVTLDGLLDDSVRAERWTFDFAPDGDGYTLTAAQWAQRCHADRGHQDYTPEPCI